MATRRCVQSAAPDLVRRAGSLGADIRDFTGRALTEPVHGLPDVALQVLWLLAAVTRECGEVFAGRRRLPRIPGDLRPLVGRQGILPLVDALPGLDLDRWEGLLAEARYALGRLGLPISAPERATMDQLFEAAVQLGRAGRETVLRKRERQLHTMDQALEAACTAVRRGGGDTQDMETALRHAADALGRGARPAGAGSDLRAVLALAVAAPQLGTRRHAFRLELRVENTGDAPARAIASRA